MPEGVAEAAGREADGVPEGVAEAAGRVAVGVPEGVAEAAGRVAEGVTVRVRVGDTEADPALSPVMTKLSSRSVPVAPDVP